MKRILFSFSFLVLMVSCGPKTPDVSGIAINLELKRFEKDFFTVDTTKIDASLQQLHQQYPMFVQDFVFNILGLPPQPDSMASVENGIKSFIYSYQPIYADANKIFTDFDKTTADVKRGLQFVKYYFPKYKAPQKLITFIGPLNSFGNVLTADALAVGLQLYMGKDYLLYQTEAGQQLYPLYISRRFSKEYIPVNCINNIIDDMYPDNYAGRPLVEQMVEAGKRLYLLDHFLPEIADTLKTGYTKKQLEGCYENEGNIWSFFVQNDLLYVAEPAITKDYMNDGPNTAVLGQAAPGLIGKFVGWQIVKKWSEKNKEISLEKLMATDAKLIFEQAKYKPKS